MTQNDLNQLINLSNHISNSKDIIDNALVGAEEIIKSEGSNLEAFDIIKKILDVAPFILALFPDLKDRLLTILVPINEELTDLINNLKN